MTQTIVRDKIESTKGGIKMKEILKSKVMIGFAIFVIGFAYLSATETKKMEENKIESDREMIVMNMQ